MYLLIYFQFLPVVYSFSGSCELLGVYSLRFLYPSHIFNVFNCTLRRGISLLKQVYNGTVWSIVFNKFYLLFIYNDVPTMKFNISFCKTHQNLTFLKALLCRETQKQRSRPLLAGGFV